jgi:mono/diheme cytochrome c family protein
MKRDFKTWIVLLAFSLPVMAALFIGSIYLFNCGTTNNCAQGFLAPVIHTPIPTLLPATLPASAVGQPANPNLTPCNAHASTLLEAWVSSGATRDIPFDFIDLNENPCSGAYIDIEPLFTQPNLWYEGSLACTDCHNANLSASAAGLDLSSYAGISAGSGRTSPGSLGTDILGTGNWNESILNQVLFVRMLMPPGASAGKLTSMGPIIQAGQLELAEIPVTPTPLGYEEVPEPSNPGPPGEAINLIGDLNNGEMIFKAHCASCHGDQGTDDVPNPGSGDGTVPALNPIDPLLKDPVYRVFATNIDLFIQHGSVPEGTIPFRTMPGWGDKGALTQQQIADVIAYIISLNP